MSFLKIYTIGCFALLLTFCKPKEAKLNTPPPPTVVDVIIAKKQSFSQEIEANGTVVAKEYVELHPEVSGRLTFLDVPEGQFVNQGKVIARINNADLIAQLAKSKSLFQLAQKQEQRLAQLLSISGINQSDYDAAINQVNSLKADINYSEALIDKTIIKAPFSGVVGLRLVSPGAYVTPISIIASIQQLSELKVDFTLPEIYANILQKGQAVEVLIEKNGKRRKAIVLAIEPQVNTASRNLKVRAILNDGKANPGSFVKVYISSGKDKSNIIVPTNAIIPDDKFKTLIIVKNGKSKFAKIQTGERQAGGVEVLSGVEEGDSIVVTGVLFVRPDASLMVKSVKNLEDLIK
jgi:membrane fusion protein, multidrug efflux system